jgi:hypothetical protein
MFPLQYQVGLKTQLVETWVATGGFNPVGIAGSGIPNTATPGTTNFFMYTDDQSIYRTLVTFKIVIYQLVAVFWVKPVCSGTNNFGNLDFISGRDWKIIEM